MMLSTRLYMFVAVFGALASEKQGEVPGAGRVGYGSYEVVRPINSPQLRGFSGSTNKFR
jgi:hypothetical protein